MKNFTRTILISIIIIFSINLITFATGEKDTEKLSSQQVDEITKKLLIEDIKHEIKMIESSISIKPTKGIFLIFIFL